MKFDNIKYSDVLRHARGTQTLRVVRNTVVEPVLGDYLGYYLPDAAAEYHEAMDFLAQPGDAPAVVLLHLPLLAPELYDGLYTLDEARRRELIDGVRALLAQLFGRLTRAVVFTFETEPDEPVVIGEPSWNAVAAELNGYLYQLAAGTSVRVADINRLRAQLGEAAMLSRRTEFSLGMRYSQEALGLMAREAARLFDGGSCKKGLVLDCDGVLWGGILAEDGLEHIGLARSGRGRAFRLFQRELLRLHGEGVLLCLASKNEERDVLYAMAEHPDMLLRPEHIAAHRIGWGSKADGIRSMAAELNLDASALAFVDDSRFETESVAAMLPETPTLCLANVKPYDFVDALRGTGWFDKPALTEDDRLRNQTYRQQKQRCGALRDAVSYEEYLDSLQTILEIKTLTDPLTLARAAELSQRTNQFNLSGRRFTEEELARLAGCADWHIYTLSASDRFGALGTVAAAVVQDRGDRAVIEGFYLSCRAFSRGFEQALLARIRDDAAGRGLRAVGVYRRTEKNKKYEQFFESFGMEVMKDEE